MAEETYGLQDYSDGSAVRSVDPVCGRPVIESTAAAKIGYWGQMFYFCSDDCKTAFVEDPEKYAGQQR